MTLVKNAPSNGVKSNTVAPKVETQTTTKLSPVPFTSLPDKMETLKAIPLDERLHRLNQLFEIQGKYNRLQASLLKLKTFTFEKNGEYGGLRITDDSRNDFGTGNNEVIEEVVKFLITTIEAKIKALEPKLVW